MAIPMLDPADPLAELLRRDKRFDVAAYIFVYDALRFAQERLNYGRIEASEEALDPGGALDGEAAEPFDEQHDPDTGERHVTGQELCEAMRRYALDQYGLLARCVLSHWGVSSTGDFGDIVFNLIEIGQMKKTERDRREDFDDVYSFDALMDGRVFSRSDVPSDAADDD